MTSTERVIDLRSDTVTLPTPEMRRAMSEAPVGDDVYGEDPSINQLEELAARIIGKEAALYLPTGTMGNQAAVMSHTSRGDEVILDAESHIFYYEVGGLAVLSGVQTRTVPSHRGEMEVEAVREAIRPDNIHFPKSTLLCLENTHNRAGGRALSLEYIDGMCQVAREAGLKVHLDGARVFNAAVALGVSPSRLVANVDSVMFCLSKGLSAPVGSMLAGTGEFITSARRSRKILGGGMRQAGILAQAGILSLTEMVKRLEEDHRLASALASGLQDLPGLRVPVPDTNIVSVFTGSSGRSAHDIVDLMRARGVLANPVDSGRIRLVTHKDVAEDDILRAVEIIREILVQVTS